MSVGQGSKELCSCVLKRSPSLHKPVLRFLMGFAHAIKY